MAGVDDGEGEAGDVEGRGHDALHVDLAHGPELEGAFEMGVERRPSGLVFAAESGEIGAEELGGGVVGDGGEHCRAEVVEDKVRVDVLVAWAGNAMIVSHLSSPHISLSVSQ